MIMMVMIVSLLLQMVILFFFVTLSPLILYLMKACGLLIVVLEPMVKNQLRRVQYGPSIESLPGKGSR